MSTTPLLIAEIENNLLGYNKVYINNLSMAKILFL
jgi:hypothetical protein